jgi:hypothetical protein
MIGPENHKFGLMWNGWVFCGKLTHFITCLSEPSDGKKMTHRDRVF